jgi:hypothetical protein
MVILEHSRSVFAPYQANRKLFAKSEKSLWKGIPQGWQVRTISERRRFGFLDET